MSVCFHRIPLLLFGFLTDWFYMSSPMSSPRSWRPLRSLRSLESRTKGRWGDQTLVESGPEGAKEKPKGEWPFTWGFTTSTSPQAPGASGYTCWSSPTIFRLSLSSYSSNYLQHGANMGPAEAPCSTGWRINKKGETWGHSHGNVCGYACCAGLSSKALQCRKSSLGLFA